MGKIDRPRKAKTVTKLMTMPKQTNLRSTWTLKVLITSLLALSFPSSGYGQVPFPDRDLSDLSKPYCETVEAAGSNGPYSQTMRYSCRAWLRGYDAAERQGAAGSSLMATNNASFGLVSPGNPSGPGTVTTSSSYTVMQAVSYYQQSAPISEAEAIILVPENEPFSTTVEAANMNALVLETSPEQIEQLRLSGAFPEAVRTDDRTLIFTRDGSAIPDLRVAGPASGYALSEDRYLDLAVSVDLIKSASRDGEN